MSYKLIMRCYLDEKAPNSPSIDIFFKCYALNNEVQTNNVTKEKGKKCHYFWKTI